MDKNKKLGIWGKEDIKREDGKYYAEDYYCVSCYADKKYTPATGFWPCVDPDIKSYPRCEECIEKKKLELIIKMTEDDMF